MSFMNVPDVAIQGAASFTIGSSTEETQDRV